MSGVYFCFRVKSVLLETQRAVQCDSEIYRIWVVVKLPTIPCNIEFVFGISVSQMKAAVSVFAGLGFRWLRE